MSIDQSLLATLDGIYAAASDHSLWEDVIRKLMDTLESQAASFCVLDSSNMAQNPVFYYLNAEKRSVDTPRFLAEYLAGMVENDPTVQHIVGHPGQQLVMDSALLSEAEKDRLSYYDWQSSFSDTRHRMAGMLTPAPQLHSGVTMHRTRQMGDFNAGHVARFNFLLPHIERAVRLGFQLGTLSAFQHASVELLDAQDRGVILLDSRGRVLFANRLARTLAEDGDGILLSRNGVSLARLSDNRRLQQLIGDAMTISEGDNSGGVMRAARPSGKRGFGILVSPLSRCSGIMAETTLAVCVTITDPARQALLPLALLKGLYGLTTAEAKLAARLARGDALAAAATELGIAYATARTQLAAIFRKTETRRQGELVRLLLSNMPERTGR